MKLLYLILAMAGFVLPYYFFVGFLAANGFEHHMALNYTPRTDVLYEAMTRYLGWKVYHHNGEDRTLFENW